MAKEYKSPHSAFLPNLVPDTVNSVLSRGVFPSSDDASSAMDERKLEINFFTMHSDSLSSKGVASVGECDSIAEVESSSSVPKKSAWNKPSSSHGVVSEVSGIVMDDDSWPTLSESARASPKSPSAYPTKRVSNGPIIIPPQGIELGSSSTTKDVGFHSLTQKPASTHVGPTRQRSMKCAASIGDGPGGASGSSTHTNMQANGSLSPKVSHRPSVREVWSSPLVVDSVGESSRYMEKDGGERAASHGRNEQQQSRHNGPFRNNNGPQFRGNGSYHHNNAGRHDPHRVINNNGNHGTQQRGSRPVMHSPAPNMQYYFYQLPYPAMPPYVHPEMTPYFWHPPLGPWIPPMSPGILNPEPLLPVPPKILEPNPELLSRILKQIDYYFSLDNLVKDTFLRENMDAQGWVSINLIANFDKVIELTDNVQYVLDAIRSSSVVELKDNKVRCRENWKRWIIPSIQHPPPTSSTLNHPSSSQNFLTDQLNHLNLN